MCSSMGDTDSDNIKYQKIITEQNQANPSKFYSQFLYKALIVIIFLVLLPLFPSQAPEFINQTIFTRSWELLHLVFVGIAVSYGLFSRRNEETEKENNNSKFDNAHSYVSRFLEVSSVFDDEAEIPSGSAENKVQTWSSQYYRNEPVVVVAREHSVLDEQRSTGDKPLLLPVRSLNPRLPDPGTTISANESESRGSFGLNSRSSSKLSSKRFSGNTNRSRNGELGGLDHVKLEEKLMDNVVLPSPIPWRSRSGRMEVKEELDSPPLYPLPTSMEDPEVNWVESRSSRSQMTQSSRPNSNTSSPKLSSPRKLSPSPSMLSAESQGKSAEDIVRKKSFYKSSPPPAPPPPPPPRIRKSSALKPSSSFVSNGVSFEKELRRTFTSEHFSRSGGESLMRRVNSGLEVKPRSQVDGLSTGKSFRATEAGETETGAWRGMDFGEDAMLGFDPSSFWTEKPNLDSFPVMSNPTFMEYSEEEKEDFVDPMNMVSEEDTETEDDETGGDFMGAEIGRSPDSGASSNNEEATSSSVSDGGPDVDRKAGEFIAKFREQIRLQRIESIKKSSGQIKRNSSR